MYEFLIFLLLILIPLALVALAYMLRRFIDAVDEYCQVEWRRLGEAQANLLEEVVDELDNPSHNNNPVECGTCGWPPCAGCPHYTHRPASGEMQ